MYCTKYFILLHILPSAWTLKKSQRNDMSDRQLINEDIQDIANNLIAVFKANDTDVTRVKASSKDFNNLRKLIKLTRTYYDNNNLQHLITHFNEALHEDKREKLKDVDVNNLKKLIKKLSISKKSGSSVTTDSGDITYRNNSRYEDSTLQTGRRIYNGYSTSIRWYAFVASVLFHHHYQCVGSIIKANLVITSASCLLLAFTNEHYSVPEEFLSVQVGSTYPVSRGQVIPVRKIYFHPDFDKMTMHNNLAILRLVKSTKFNEKIRKIAIDKDGHHYEGKVKILGWGHKYSADHHNINTADRKLSYAKVDVYPLRECQEIYTKHVVDKRNLCVGYFSKPGGGCERDSGAPGVVDGKLIGVVSFVPAECGLPNTPTVLTKLVYYVDWIEDIIEKTRHHRPEPPTTNEPSDSSSEDRPLIKWPHLYYSDFIKTSKTTPRPTTTYIIISPLRHPIEDEIAEGRFSTVISDFDDVTEKSKEKVSNIKEEGIKEYYSTSNENVNDLAKQDANVDQYDVLTAKPDEVITKVPSNSSSTIQTIAKLLTNFWFSITNKGAKGNSE